MNSNWASKGTSISNSSSNPNHKKTFNSNLNGAKSGKETRGMAKTTFKSVRNNGDEDDEALCLPTKDSLMVSDTNNTEAQVVANSWDTWDSHIDTSKVTQELKKPEEIIGGQMIFTVNNSRVKDIEKDNTVYEPEEEEQGLNLLEAIEKEALKTNKKNDKKVGEISKPDDTRDEGQNSRGAYNERGGYKDNNNSYGRNYNDNNGRNYNNNRSNNDNGKVPYNERGGKGRPNENGRNQQQDNKREFNDKGRKYDNNNNYQPNNYNNNNNNNQRDKNASYNSYEDDRNHQEKDTKQQSQRFYDKSNQDKDLNNNEGGNNQRENGKNQNQGDYQRRDINSNSVSNTTNKEQDTGATSGSQGNDDRVMFSVNKNRVIYEEPEPKYSNIQVFCQPPQKQQPQQYVQQQYPPREQNKYEEEKQDQQMQNQQNKPTIKRDSQQNQQSRENPEGEDQIAKNGRQQYYNNSNNTNPSARQKPNNNNSNARNSNDSGEQEDGNVQPKYQQKNTKKPRKQEVIYVPKNKE